MPVAQARTLMTNNFFFMGHTRGLAQGVVKGLRVTGFGPVTIERHEGLSSLVCVERRTGRLV